jgi:hypothetical protein
MDTHPDKEEIISLLQSGESPIEISKMLQEKYPDKPDFWMNQDTLYKIRVKLFPALAEEAQLRRIETGQATRKGKNERKIDPDSLISKKPLKEEDIATRVMKLTGKVPPPPDPRRDISDDEIMSISDGVKGFINYAENFTNEAMDKVVLQDYQKEMAKIIIENDRVCISAGGQVGKDFMMQELLTWDCITYPGAFHVVACATQSQSLALMNRIVAMMKANEDLWLCVADTPQKPDAGIFFKNGSRVLFLTAKSLVAGHTRIRKLWINEARDINEEEVTRITPLLGVGGGSMVVLSRPRFKRGFFWDCFSSPVFKTMIIPTEWNVHFDKGVLEKNRATMSPDLFKIEHLGLFADVGSNYISENAIKECSKNDFDVKGMVADDDYEYCLGIDWARFRDTAVFIVVGRHKITKHKRIFHVGFYSPDKNDTNKSSFANQIGYIDLLDSKFDFKTIVPESSGMGIPLCEDLAREWRRLGKNPSKIKPYNNRSLQDKLSMYDELKRTIETHEIDIPRGESRLVSELMLVTFGVTKTGNITIEHPTTDDYADCLALCLQGFISVFQISVAVAKIKKTISNTGVHR